MITLALVLQLLFAFPVTGAYALPWNHKDIVVCVTYAGTRPTKVCTHIFAVEDQEMTHDIDRPHCWAPKNDVGSLDIWPNVRIDEANWKVIVTYPDRQETIPLVTRVNS